MPTYKRRPNCVNRRTRGREREKGERKLRHKKGECSTRLRGTRKKWKERPLGLLLGNSRVAEQMEEKEEGSSEPMVRLFLSLSLYLSPTFKVFVHLGYIRQFVLIAIRE